MQLVATPQRAKYLAHQLCLTKTFTSFGLFYFTRVRIRSEPVGLTSANLPLLIAAR